MGIYLFSQLMESVDEQLAPHFVTLHGIILAALHDASSDVRIAAMASIPSYVSK
jgi:hypothetical protein